MSYKDSSKAIPERVELLLQQMTVEEKVGQLIQPFGWQVYEKGNDGTIKLTEAFKDQVRQGGVGSLYGVLRADPWTGVTLETGLSAGQGAEAINAIQRFAMEESRLGIPILFGEECSHGHMAIGATVYPVPLSLGSTWNVELYRQVCEAIAAETRSQGGAATYSPVLDVVRDPRWGRTEECFGEDPYMIGEYARASIEGLQGESLDADDRVLATLKHFVAYGSSEGGRNAGPVHMGWRELHEVDLYPFKKAVEAGALSVMTAYNEIDGVPCTTNAYLLNEVLRKQWGFEGFIITDCGAIEMLASGHDVAADGEEAAVMAVEAGVDMEMSGVMFGGLLNSLEQGRLQEATLDEAVRRILNVKFKLGLFDRPYVDPAKAEQVIGSEKHIRLARQAAAEGVILLKNEGGVLPLSKEEAGTIAVIGPNADAMYHQLGDYTSPQARSQIATVLDGVRGVVGDARVKYAPGCYINSDAKDGFERALECAADADAVVLVLGGSSARDFGEGSIDLRTGASVVTGHSDMECGEGIDRVSLALRGVQLELVQAVHALGKPVIVVYINGRPVTEPWIDEHADAILEAWYPGQEGGHAIADILFGDVNPSGRLTVSIPKDVGQLPVYYNAKRSRGKRYLEMDLEPRYPFGYGLGYTTFAYENLQLSAAEIEAGQSVEVQVEVTNTGERTGQEVVQLYITDVVSTVTRPRLELKGFEKVSLGPGEKRKVTFTVKPEHLHLIGADTKPIVEPGEFTVTVGRDCREGLTGRLMVKP